MSEITDSHNHDKPNRLRSLGVATVLGGTALIGAFPISSNGALDHMPPVAISSARGMMEINPNKLLVPAQVEKVMQQNTVVIPKLGCSGFLLRNSRNSAVGVVTAQHCSLLVSKNNSYLAQVNNQTVLEEQGLVEAYTGNTPKSLSLAGNIDKFVIGREAFNKDTDIAIGSFRGHTIAEAEKSYKAMSLTENGINELKPGQVIYNSGWPVYQSNSPASMERQSFAMTYLGNADWSEADGLNMKLAVAAVPASKNGAECSWGNSGSAAFTLDSNGKPKIIGILSAFGDFGFLENKNNSVASKEWKTYIEQKFHISMNGFAAVCGFAYQTPTRSNSEQVNVINTNAAK